MKRKLFGALLLALLPVLAFAGVASAQTFRTGQSTSVGSNETTDGSVWISGSSVDVAGTINGDLYCVGQNVTISAHVMGDVLCAGQTVTLSGTVDGSVRLAGQSVSVSGNIAKSLSVAGQTVTLEGNGKVDRDASFFGQTANINGQITRDAVIGAASATLNADVGRNVSAHLNDLTVGSAATIAGNLTYSGPQKATVDSSAKISGKTIFNHQQQNQSEGIGLSLAAIAVWGLMLIVSALLISLLFPRELQRITDIGVVSFPRVLLAGLVGLIAGIIMPVVVIILMATVLGIPFAVVVAVTWVLILLLSGSVTSYYLGRVLWRGQTNAILRMLLGSVILTILLLIPFLDVLVFFLAVWYGSGAILIELQRHLAAPSYTMQSTRSRSRSRA